MDNYVVRHVLVIVLIVVLFGVASYHSVLNSGNLAFENPRIGFKVRNTPISNRLLALNNTLCATKASPSMKDSTCAYTSLKNDSKSSSGCLLCSTEPTTDAATVVFKTTDGSDLLDVSNVRILCKMHSRLEFLLKDSSLELPCKPDCKRCCQIFSLPYYLMSISNSSRCDNLKDDLIQSSAVSLRTCRDKTKEKQDCSQTELLKILRAMTDRDFVDGRSNGVKYTSMFFAFSGKSADLTVSFYKAFQDLDLDEPPVEMAGAWFGRQLYTRLFSHLVLADLAFFALAALGVVCVLLINTRSAFIIFMTLCSILMTMVFAFSIYTCILRIKYFPFLNLLALALLIAVGSDALLVYQKYWDSNKTKTMHLVDNQNFSFVDFVWKTFKEAGLSMMATTITTAGALIASYATPVITVRCFAVFSSICIVINLILMVTWIPGAFVLRETMCSWNLSRFICQGEPGTGVGGFFRLVKSTVFKIFCAVMKLFPLWLLLALAVLFVSVFIIFYKPGYEHPVKETRLLVASNTLEKYTLLKTDLSFVSPPPDIFALLVFGVTPKGTGSPLDPHDDGEASFINNFDVAKPSSQQWLYDLCSIIKRSGFYDLDAMQELHSTACIMVPFRAFMERKCFAFQKKSCCGKTAADFPYQSKIFLSCMNEYTSFVTKVYFLRLKQTRYEISKLDLTPMLALNTLCWATSKLCCRYIGYAFYDPLVWDCLRTLFWAFSSEFHANKTLDVQMGRDILINKCRLSEDAWQKILKVTVAFFITKCVMPSVHFFKYFLKQPNLKLGMRYDKKGNIKAVIVAFKTNITRTYRYKENAEISSRLDNWFEGISKTIPSELKEGFVTTKSLDWYELQRSLVVNLPASFFISFSLALVVTALTTTSFFLSIFCVLAIVCTVFITAACIVLLQWKLDILESLIINLSVGMSIDLPLHLAVGYKLNIREPSASIALYTVHKIGPVTITTGLTTAVAGLCILTVNVYGYYQLGAFLAVLMSASMVCTLLFFPSLLILYEFVLKLFRSKGSAGQSVELLANVNRDVDIAQASS